MQAQNATNLQTSKSCQESTVLLPKNGRNDISIFAAKKRLMYAPVLECRLGKTGNETGKQF
jgi:hypothetical protein